MPEPAPEPAPPPVTRADCEAWSKKYIAVLEDKMLQEIDDPTMKAQVLESGRAMLAGQEAGLASECLAKFVRSDLDCFEAAEGFDAFGRCLDAVTQRQPIPVSDTKPKPPSPPKSQVFSKAARDRAVATLREVAARIPNDVDNVMVTRREREAGDEIEVLAAVAIEVLSPLPLPDQTVMHASINTGLPAILWSDAYQDQGVDVTWYDEWFFDAPLPFAVIANMGRHKGLRAHGGCEEDDEGLRRAQGHAVHGSVDALYNTVCLDDQFAVALSGEYTDELLERTAAGAVGGSPAARLAAAEPLHEGTWYVSTWASNDPGPTRVDRVVVTAQTEPGATSTLITLRAHPAGKPNAVTAAFRDALSKVKASALRDAATLAQREGWTVVELRVDHAAALEVFERVGDVRQFELINARQPKHAGR